MKTLFSYYKVLIVAVMAMGMVATFSDSTASASNPAPGVICDLGPDVHCYQLVETAMNWYDADDHAQTLSHDGVSGHLVTITSASELTFIKDSFPALFSPIVDDFYNPGSDEEKFSWIGGFREGNHEVAFGPWQWVTGEAWSFADENFSPGQASGGHYDSEHDGPNATHTHPSDSRGVLEFFHDGGPYTYTGKWNDQNPVGATRYFIVEYDNFQSTTFLGGVLDGAVSPQLDPYVEYYNEDTEEWQPAWLVGWHPWGFVDGTDSWINCGPLQETPGFGRGYSCESETSTYRMTFDVPATWYDASLDLQVKADNFGTVYLNGTEIQAKTAGATSGVDIDVNSSLQTGTNELIFVIEDIDGLAGFNYRADISGFSTAPIEVIEADSDGDGIPNSTDALPNDFDNDGVDDIDDNCPAVANTDQLDLDGDLIGNVCDDDIDGDNITNDDEITNGTDPWLADTDGDGINDDVDAYPLDFDNDGVDDDVDEVPSSDMSGTVTIGSCDIDSLVTASGATFADLITALGDPANHGNYVGAVSALANDWKKDGLISGRVKGEITSCAAQSDEGKPAKSVGKGKK
jgi:hypothetical protein